MPRPPALRREVRDDAPHRVAELLRAHVALGGGKRNEIVDRDRTFRRQQHDLGDGPELVLEPIAHEPPRTWMGAKGPVCTRSTARSRHSSRSASRVTTTPARPSEGVNSAVNSTCPAPSAPSRESTDAMAFAHGQGLAGDMVRRIHRGPGDDVREGRRQVGERRRGAAGATAR